MPKQGIKTTFGEPSLRTETQPEAAFNELEQNVKHIKKIAPQQTKDMSGQKPVLAGPGALGGCIPVGN